MSLFGFNADDVIGGVVIRSIVQGGPLDAANNASLASTGAVVMDAGDVIRLVNGSQATVAGLLAIDANFPPGTTLLIDAIATAFGNFPYSVFFTLGGTPGGPPGGTLSFSSGPVPRPAGPGSTGGTSHPSTIPIGHPSNPIGHPGGSGS